MTDIYEVSLLARMTHLSQSLQLLRYDDIVIMLFTFLAFSTVT